MKAFLLASLFMGSFGIAQLQAKDAKDPVLNIVADQVARSEYLALEMAPIKTRRAMDLYIQSVPQEISAFKDIPIAERNQFLNSLKFNEKGLTEFDPSALKKLTPTQVYRVLALFGLEGGAYKINGASRTNLDKDVNVEPAAASGVFLEGYRCEERATCGESQRAACTSNC